MWIQREISHYITENSAEPVQIIVGPRQCGKSSLLTHLGSGYTEVTFDDFQLRSLAQADPALFLSNYKTPLILDEVQYVPNLFPTIKQHIDKMRQARLTDAGKKIEVLFRLTGSNQILMDKNIKESLAGRAGFYYLNTLTVSELRHAQPELSTLDILFKGGWPELYVSDLDVVKYLNDYIRSYIEKDIVLSAGISKQAEFHTLLGLLAARTGETVNFSALANDSGVRSGTIKEWVSFLERSDILYLLKPYSNNLNKRLTKSPKLHFFDTGLACRLQGWTTREPMFHSSQAGHLFESLVFGEVMKFIRNHGKAWQLFYWRTRDGEEIDFLLQKDNGTMIAIDAKLGIHSVLPTELPPSFQETFPAVQKLYIVSIGGHRQRLSTKCEQIPISELARFLREGELQKE
jgi:predicted AAA+ superfamily ATPase